MTENRIPELTAEHQALTQAYRDACVNQSQQKIALTNQVELTRIAEKVAKELREELRAKTEELQKEMDRHHNRAALANPSLMRPS